MSRDTVSVLFIEDDALVRDALAGALRREDGLRVAGCVGFDEGGALFERGFEDKPDVLVVGVGLPGFQGLALLERAAAEAPAMACVALLHRRSEAMLIQILGLGVLACVSRNDRLESFVESVRRAAAGDRYVSSELAPILVSAAAGHAQGQRGIAALSRRERQVLTWIAEGLSTREIGEKLAISPRTVETHRARLMEKLQVRRTSHLIRIAVEEGLVAR